MGRKNAGHAAAARSILVLMLLMVVQVRAGIYYYCWGGCLNQCVLLTSKGAPPAADKLPCYMNCVSDCLTRPSVVVPPRPPNSDNSLPLEIPDNYKTSSSSTTPRPPQYYCWLGCTLETCMLVSRDAAELKTCLSSCTTLCKP